MIGKPEVVIAEVPKSRSDAFRVTIRSVREGRQIRVALVHRYAGGQVEVPGKSISLRPDQVDPIIDALARAKTTAFDQTVAASLGWLINHNPDRNGDAK